MPDTAAARFLAENSRIRTVAIGTPGWVDLQSSNAEGARKFYTDLFSWSVDVIADPQAGGYGMFKLGGKDVGGVGPVQNPGQPTVWMPYVLVDDAGATVKRIKEAGGQVFAEPLDVMGEGTMAVVADPSGATFGLWQPGRHQGFEVRDVPGSVTWVELSTRDLPAAEAFYRDVFGWEPADSELPDKYTVFNFDGNQIAGALDMPEMVPQDVPSYWLVYFAAADADEVAANAKTLGGREIVSPTDIPAVGRFAVLQDPQGGTFGILQVPSPDEAPS